ncbi:DUF2924 domain-containing protein [Sphingomonas sp. ASV193]|uniref:DUF2924 domain-containing protein n=1 Tax=Sphingomonas sp. ASV193 TaxID=3144405 RepID=UPI0032E88E00
MTRHELDDALTNLETMSLGDLRDAWSKHTRSTPPNVSAGVLRLALAHHLQSKVMGGVPKSVERRLATIVGGNAARTANPGTRYVREWRGKVHVVTMTEDGRYRWRDRDWPSLSVIAREITGTQWSGPAFFGTKTGKRAA